MNVSGKETGGFDDFWTGSGEFLVDENIYDSREKRALFRFLTYTQRWWYITSSFIMRIAAAVGSVYAFVTDWDSW
jgi:hypothetical protein